MLIQEAWKWILGRVITVYVPHMMITVLGQKGGHWLYRSRMMKYQVILTEQDGVILKTTNLVNPAVSFSSVQEKGQLERDCLATIKHVYPSQEDLKRETAGWSWSGPVYRWQHLCGKWNLLHRICGDNWKFCHRSKFFTLHNFSSEGRTESLDKGIRAK